MDWMAVDSREVVKLDFAVDFVVVVFLQKQLQEFQWLLVDQLRCHLVNSLPRPFQILPPRAVLEIFWKNDVSVFVFLQTYFQRDLAAVAAFSRVLSCARHVLLVE